MREDEVNPLNAKPGDTITIRGRAYDVLSITREAVMTSRAQDPSGFETVTIYYLHDRVSNALHPTHTLTYHPDTKTYTLTFCKTLPISRMDIHVQPGDEEA